jgi:hypothetical protein
MGGIYGQQSIRERALKLSRKPGTAIIFVQADLENRPTRQINADAILAGARIAPVICNDKRSASRSAYRFGAELRSVRVAGVALRAPPINSLER